MLASDVTIPSNGFVVRDARPSRWCQAITTSRVGLLLIAKSKDNNVTVYNNHVFFPLIMLSNTIKKVVVLLTSESSNNSIQ